MPVVAIVFSSILYAASLILMRRVQIISPLCAFLGLLVLSMGKTSQGFAVLPISSSMIFGWLCVAVLVTVITLLQPKGVRNSTKGVIYLEVGAIVGMAIGLLGFTITTFAGALYAIMIICTAAGTFFGYLLYVNTPDGRGVGMGSGRFFSYFLAKGFPAAVTVMQAGVVLVLIIAVKNIQIYW